MTDLDGTHATHFGSPQEMQDRAAVRKFLDRSGFVSGAVTARTPALTMSHSVYLASRELGFAEPEPHCGLDESGKRTFVPLEELPQFAHSLDWDLVAGLGSGVYPRNGYGYLVDHEFDELLNYDHIREQPFDPGVESMAWRGAAMLLLLDYPWVKDHLASIEFGSNYIDGITNVAPLPYRIQLDFKGSVGLAHMRELRAELRNQKFLNNPIALRMAVVDESKPHPDPEQCAYTIYLVPWAARKEKMINHLVFQSTSAAGVPPDEIRLFYAGDTPTDLRAGLWAGGYTPLTFLLASGSSLAPYLIERRPAFGEVSLGFLSYLRGTGKRGIYTVKVPTRRWSNTVIIGDERYPGTTPPGSVLAFLNEFANDSAGH